MPYQGLDVTDFFRRTSGLGSEKDPTDVKTSPTAGMFSAARNYGSGFGKSEGFGFQGIGHAATEGVNSIVGGLKAGQDAAMNAGATALDVIGGNKASKLFAAAQERGAAAQASAQKAANTKNLIGGIGSAAIAVGVGALL